MLCRLTKIQLLLMVHVTSSLNHRFRTILYTLYPAGVVTFSLHRHAHTHTQTHTYTYTYTHIHTRTHTHAHTHIHTYTHTHTQTDTHKHIHQRKHSTIDVTNFCPYFAVVTNYNKTQIRLKSYKLWGSSIVKNCGN